MNIYPALDILDGKVVRLRQGDFTTAVTYHDDPVACARTYAASGPEWLHVVDLSGARDPQQRQVELLLRMTTDADVRLQVGGGVRTPESVAQLLEAGAARVVVGSLAVRDPDATLGLAARFGAQRITVALDCRVDADGHPWLVSHGWQRQHARDLYTALERYLDAGVTNFLCTDIERDGILEGPNLQLYERLQARFPQAAVQASAGVRDARDITALAAAGAAGAVIGRALLEGTLSIRDAMQAAAATQNEMPSGSASECAPTAAASPYSRR